MGMGLLDRMMAPFWNSEVTYEESVLMVSDEGELPSAPLLFEPTEILSVKNARLEEEYEEGRDLTWADGRLRLLPGTRMPYMTREELYPDPPDRVWSQRKRGGGFVLYRQGHYFHDRQISVSYRHAGQTWQGPTPSSAEPLLPRTVDKLRNRIPIKMALYGDSISEGFNASGYATRMSAGAPPFLPRWGDLLAEWLRIRYDSDIEFVNPSVAGKDSAWGLEEARRRVGEERPDLTIVAFGMNDGTNGVPPERFGRNVQAIIGEIRSLRSDAEFIVVAPTLANPETFFDGVQRDYLDVLRSMEGEGVASANLTGVHEKLLERKRFADMTGNNINHPNDYLSRWHAQFLAGMLLGPEHSPVRRPR